MKRPATTRKKTIERDGELSSSEELVKLQKISSEISADPESSRRFLVKTGIYDASGNLTKAYR